MIGGVTTHASFAVTRALDQTSKPPKRLNALSREEWLARLADKLRPLFEKAGADLPARIRYSCGWPSANGLSRRRRVMGECWLAHVSADESIEIFVSPLVDDTQEVGAILVHELVHACGRRGHGKEFAALARAVGLTGPMRSSVAGDALKRTLARLAHQCGPYPHGAMNPGEEPAGDDVPKKQGTRMLKLVCPHDGYTVRTTRRWIEVGLPSCPCGEELAAEDAGDEAVSA